MLFDLDETTDDDLDDLVDVTEAEDGGGVFPSAKASSDLYGHLDIEQKLLQMLDMGRFPHGLVFSGPSGVGKSVMAYRLARFLFTESDRVADMFGTPEKPESLFVPDTHPIFSKVASGGHPDLLMIGRPIDDETGRMKASVPVEEIRRIAPFMRKTASARGGWRIVIVDDADTMTRSSQNSLLKILEEPPEKALLILITHRAGALLPTVYSRCVHLPFPPLEEKVIRETLAPRVLPLDLDLIVALAEGSLGRAIDYAHPDNLDVVKQAFSYLENWPQLKWSSIQSFADTFGTKGNDDAQRVFRETMLWLASSVVRGQSQNLPIIDNLVANLSLERKLKLYDALAEHFSRCVGGNLDKRFMILGAYMAFEG